MPVFDESVSIVRQPPPRSDTKEAEEVEAYLQDLAQDQLRLIQLLPVAQIALTENETQQIQVFQAAQLVLGPAATAPMTCSEKCPTPIRSNCLLAQFGKEPIGKKCPYEQQYIGQRFTCRTTGGGCATSLPLGRTLIKPAMPTSEHIYRRKRGNRLRVLCRLIGHFIWWRADLRYRPNVLYTLRGRCALCRGRYLKETRLHTSQGHESSRFPLGPRAIHFATPWSRIRHEETD
jgi:hypothetical protein